MPQATFNGRHSWLWHVGRPLALVPGVSQEVGQGVGGPRVARRAAADALHLGRPLGLYVEVGGQGCRCARPSGRPTTKQHNSQPLERPLLWCFMKE
jgi:hypothetical protein